MNADTVSQQNINQQNQENEGGMMVINSAISQNVISSAMLHVKLSKMVGVNTDG